MASNKARVQLADGRWADVVSLDGASSATGVSSTDNANFTIVASSTSAGTLLAANADRKTASIFNDSTAVLYVAEFPTAEATVSAVNCSYQVAPGGVAFVAPEYNGLVQGLWASVNGSARVTEH